VAYSSRPIRGVLKLILKPGKSGWRAFALGMPSWRRSYSRKSALSTQALASR
jgi:hypothetical protein